MSDAIAGGISVTTSGIFAGEARAVSAPPTAALDPSPAVAGFPPIPAQEQFGTGLNILSRE